MRAASVLPVVGRRKEGDGETERWGEKSQRPQEALLSDYSALGSSVLRFFLGAKPYPKLLERLNGNWYSLERAFHDDPILHDALESADDHPAAADLVELAHDN